MASSSVFRSQVSPEKQLSKLKWAFRDAVRSLGLQGHFKGRRQLALQAFIDCMGSDGSLFPSHATVAARAGVAEKTAWFALNEAESLGLLRVTPRYVYDEEKRKRGRTSNAYEIVTGALEQAKAAAVGLWRKVKEAKQRAAAAYRRHACDHLTVTKTVESPLPLFKKLRSPYQQAQGTPEEMKYYLSLPSEAAEAFRLAKGWQI